MKINKINYEAYIVDYLDGTLPPADLQAMEAFLQRHPDIQAEVDLMRDWQLPVLPALALPDKSMLLKSEEKPHRRIFLFRAIAASLLVLISAAGFLWYQSHLNPSESQPNYLMVESTTTKEKMQIESSHSDEMKTTPEEVATSTLSKEQKTDPVKLDQKYADPNHLSKQEIVADAKDIHFEDKSKLQLDPIADKIQLNPVELPEVAQNQERAVLPLITPSTSEVVEAMIEERRWQAFMSLPTLKMQKTVKSSFPDLYIQLDDEALLAQTDRMIDREKIVQLIQPESFTDGNEKGSIKDALIPEVFSSLFRKSSKTD